MTGSDSANHELKYLRYLCIDVSDADEELEAFIVPHIFEVYDAIDKHILAGNKYYGDIVEKVEKIREVYLSGE